MDSRVLGPMALLGLIFGALCGWLAWQDWYIFSKGSATPQVIALADLAAKGPGNNVHVQVTNLSFGRDYVYETKKDTWNRVWIPLIGPDGSIKVVVKSFNLKNDGQVQQFCQRPDVTGILTNDIHSLGSSERDKLQLSYPGVDFSKALVLEEGRAFPSAGRVYLLLAGALLLLLMSAVGGLLSLSAHKREKAEALGLAQASEKPQVGELPAEASRWGEPLQVFTCAADARNLIAGGVGFMVVFGGIAAFALTHTKPEEMVLGCSLMGGFQLLFLCFVVIGIVKLRRRVLVFPEGVLVQRGRRSIVCPWDEVEALHGFVRVGPLFYVGGPLVLKRRDGRVLPLQANNKDTAALADLVYEEAVTYLLPRSLERIRRGEAVAFGPLSLDRHGIKQANGESLAWDEVEVNLSHEKFMVRHTSTRRLWWSAEVAKVPTVPLFFALSKALKNGGNRGG